MTETTIVSNPPQSKHPNGQEFTGQVRVIMSSGNLIIELENQHVQQVNHQKSSRNDPNVHPFIRCYGKKSPADFCGVHASWGSIPAPACCSSHSKGTRSLLMGVVVVRHRLRAFGVDRSPGHQFHVVRLLLEIRRRSRSDRRGRPL